MPKQTRWAIKQGMERAAGNLDAAQAHLVAEGARFEGTHDDYYQKFCALIQGIEAIKKAILVLRETI